MNGVNEAAMIKAISSFGDNCEDQMRSIVKAMPLSEQKRLLPSALNAARCLEWLSPGVMGMTSSGFIGGVFSNIRPDGIAIVVASPTKMMISITQIEFLDGHVDNATIRLDESGVERDKHNSFFAAVIMELLKNHGSPAKSKDEPKPVQNLVLADLMVWRARENINLLKEANDNGIATAIVALEARKKDGVAVVPVCYARHMPKEIISTLDG